MQRKPVPGPTLDPTEPPFPAERAFVVQLRGAAGLSGDLFVGRVEHIASGAVRRFGSADGLIAFIQETLALPQLATNRT
jgi:hypothetical protein